MKRPTFTDTLHWLNHLASEIARHLIWMVFAVVGQATIIENPDTVSGTGKVAIQGSASIIEAPDSLLASGRIALPKVVQPVGAST